MIRISRACHMMIAYSDFHSRVSAVANRLHIFYSSNVYSIVMRIFFWALLFSLSINRGTSTEQFIISKAGYPVILVPGDGGTHMEARLDKPSVVHYLCNKKTADFFNIWLNLELMVPLILDCWVDNVRLEYNNLTRRTSNSPGVETRIPDFGNTTSIEWLDPSKSSYGAYFKDVVDSLLPLGYERGISIFGAPYDFRKAPNECEDYFINLKQLIETAYESNGQPIILIAHSMGGPFMLYFLNRQTQAWKDTHIRALVTLAGVWGGAVKALRVFASGDNLGVYVLSAWTLRTEQITSPSLAFLLPKGDFWAEDEVLISTTAKNYTIKDFKAYFTDLNYNTGYDMWLDTKDLVHDLKPPGVEVHCLYGVGVQTEEHILYKTIPSNSPTMIYGQGDGTVNLKSLEGCLRWEGKQRQKVYSHTFQGVDHMAIISNPDAIAYIHSLVTGNRL